MSDVSWSYDPAGPTPFVLNVGYGGDSIAILNGERGAIQRFSFADGSVLTFDELIASHGGINLAATNTADQFIALPYSYPAGNNLVVGGDGADTINLDNGSSNFVVGGKGNDRIDANGWSNEENIVLLNLGDGQDELVIGEASHPVTVLFGANIDQAGLKITVHDYVNGWGDRWQDMTIQYGDQGDQVFINGSIPQPGEGGNDPSLRVKFADGTELNYSELMNKASSDHPVMDASSGSRIIADPTSPVLVGGTGNDTFVIGNQPAEYRIIDNVVGVGSNAVELGWEMGGISDQSMLEDEPWTMHVTAVPGSAYRLSIEGTNLRVSFDNGVTLRIDGFDPNSPIDSTSIKEFRFANGRVLSLEQVLAQGFDLAGTGNADDMAGTALDDRIQSGNGDDYLDGRTGNDVLAGGDGNDTYAYNLGDGADVIVDHAGYWDRQGYVVNENVLQFGYGIDAASVAVKFDPANGQVFLDLGNGDSINIGTTDDLAIQFVQFVDGTVWDGWALIDRISVGNNPNAVPDANLSPATGGMAGAVSYQAVLADGSPLPAWLTFDASTNTFSGTPGNNDVGTLHVRVNVTDGAGIVTARDFTLDVLNVNDAPTVSMFVADQSTLEDAPFSFTVPAGTFNDVDFIHGDTLTYSATLSDPSTSSGQAPLPSWLTFDAATGTFSGTPGNTDVGNLNVLVTATDTGGLSASSTFNLNVVNVNDTPTANADTGTATEDGGAMLLDAAVLLANDTDPDFIHGDVLNIVGVSQAASGAAVSLLPSTSSGQGGAVQYDAGALFQSLGQGQTATDTFSYTVSDMAGATSTATVTMTITGVNDGPVALNDAAAVQEDAALVATGNVLANDTDVDQGAVLSVANAGTLQGSYGSLVLNADGSYTYALDNASTAVQGLRAGQSATETFAYQATDGIAITPATLTVTINGANDAPVVASLIAGQQTNEDAPFSFTVPVATFTDIDTGDTLTYSATLADGTALPSWLSFDAATQTFNGTPGNWDVGNYSVTVTATDTGGLSASSTFAVDVANVNDAPTVNMALLDQGALQDAAFSFTVPAGTFNDVDFIHGDTLTYGATLADGTALPGWLTFDAATQTFSGTPLNQDVGSLNLLVTATDTGGLSASSAFSLNVVNVNDAPTANADAGVATEDGGAVLLDAAVLLANDTDPDFIHGDALNIVGVSQAASGAAVSLLNGAVQYDTGMLFQSLAQGQTATDTFSYTVSDMAGATSTATVTMTVTGVNDGPVTVNDAAAVQEDAALVATGNVLANDTDVDQGTVLSVANAGTLQGNYGSLLLNADGGYSYALDNTSAAVQGLMAGQTVTETFAYQATDGIATTPATLTVTITGSNDAPVAQNDAATVNEDSLLSIQSGALLANDTDADIGDTRVLVGVDALSALGSSVSLVNGQVVYDQGGQFNSLLAGQSVIDSFSYAMTDSAGAASSATVSVTVTGVNDGPQANGDSATMGEDTPQTTLTAANLLFNDTDPDTGDVLSIAGFDSITTLGNAVSMDAAGNLVFDPSTSSGQGNRYQYLAQGQTATDTFSYTITDTAGAASTAQVNMTIAGLNDAPVAAADVAYAQEDLNITATGNVLSNDSDVDQGTVLSVADAGIRAGGYGSLNLAADGSYTYTLDNASPLVQSLGRDAQVVEHFGYTATDGIAGTAAVLDVFLNGTNDAPILVAPLADQDFTFNKHFSWQMPEGSFTDIDQGDTLGYAATLADGSALPDWLSFDAATRTFSGETPKQAGFMDVQVTATDSVAATGSTAGSLSASDVFRISVSHGNEGVGNGKDAPPPGHDRNTNDGGGTAPGRPGSKGGNGHPTASAAHPQEQEPHDRSSDAKKHKDDTPQQDTGDSGSQRTDELIRTWFEEESTSERYSSFSTLDRHGAWGGQVDRQVKRNVAKGVSGDVSSEWERMNAQLKKHLEQSGGDDAHFFESGTGSRSFGLFGSGGQQGIPQLGTGNGQQLKALSGLKEGLERLGC